MAQQLTHMLEGLSETPFLQGLLAALCTFILEDPTTLGCALLVADGQMHYGTALIGLWLGIGIGDWGLYALGRAVGPRTLAWGLVSQHRLDRARAWFERNLVTAVFVSRFIPGLRLPANIGAGVLKTSAARYLPIAMTASLVWTFLALTVISKLGEAVLPLLGQLKWPVGIALVLLLVFMQRRSMKQLDKAPHPSDIEGNLVSPFEFWHPVIFYTPVAFYYVWLAARYRGLMLPTAANPNIYSGGMIRESKCEILDMVPEQHRQWTAPHARYAKPEDDIPVQAMADAALEAVREAGFDLPIVAKPDQGQRGLGVRPIRTRAELESYLQAYPAGSTICLQELVHFSEEAGLLYYRLPEEERGHILSITLKEFPRIVGDGARTLRELIEADYRARMLKGVYFERHARSLDRVLEAGEEFPLVFAGNHKQGCIFHDGYHILTDELTRRVDEIARGLPEFYYGRFDIRFEALDAFQRAEKFRIVEINGAGAEATHIWDPTARLRDAYRTLFEQFDILFRIGHSNRKRGFRPLGPIRFLRDVVLYHRVARKYPLAD